MTLYAYVDESGTHDPTGQAKGARDAVLGAIVAKPETWRAFCKDWQSALSHYDAPYFHYCEWSEAAKVARGKKKPNSNFKKNPYRSWSHQTLDRFILKLAQIAGSQVAGKKVFYTTCMRTRRFHEHKTKGRISPNADPYVFAFREFFAGLIGEVDKARPHWKGFPISFFFDRVDKAWAKFALEWFVSKKAENPLLDSLSFQDKKEHLPLQAADMLAYRFRQVTENFFDDRSIVPSEVDLALFKPAFEVVGNLDEPDPSVIKAWKA